ncbi:MAG: GTP 3',8-cyclase MoaA [Nitrospirae bacterium]|nr:MAG: GTP 3',8-cyclase MoaA [Nitrospirota bacterium]
MGQLDDPAAAGVATWRAPVGPALVDPQGRAIRYLRLSVTDRCNLRCRYCMPAAGLDWVPRREILSWEELERLVRICTRLGVGKVRITGGEPFVRRGLLSFLAAIRPLPGLETLAITTNGVGAAPHARRLAAIGVDAVNLSLDALDPAVFRRMSRRDRLEEALASLEALLAAGLRVKVNAVVVAGMNEGQILPLAELARERPLEVRFIEAMPFDGGGRRHAGWPAERILAHLAAHLPSLEPVAAAGTARTFRVAGFAGRVGVIAGESRSFCATCDRLRITARGAVKTCLYGEPSVELRPLLRAGADDAAVAAALERAVAGRHPDGFAAEAARSRRLAVSMAAIGG